MLPAPTLKTILDESSRRTAGRRRLVSILLATPDTASIASLRHNVAYFDARTGESWDLHVAGYYAYGRTHYDPAGFPVGIFLGGDPQTEWWFSPQHFERLRCALEMQHKNHMTRSGLIRRRTPWRYSGTPEIVSMWTDDAIADWDSLVACRLTEEAPLAHVVETHTDWRRGQLPAGFQPGTRPRAVGQALHADALRRGLSWAIAGAAGAALTEGVTVLIDELTRH